MFGWNNFYSNHTYLTIELYIIGAHSSNNPSWNDGQKWYQYSKKRIWIQFLKSFILFDWLNAYSKIWKVNTNQLLNILYKLVGPTSIAEPIHEWHVYWVYILNKYSDAIRLCTLNILCYNFRSNKLFSPSLWVCVKCWSSNINGYSDIPLKKEKKNLQRREQQIKRQRRVVQNKGAKKQRDQKRPKNSNMPTKYSTIIRIRWWSRHRFISKDKGGFNGLVVQSIRDVDDLLEIHL